MLMQWCLQQQHTGSAALIRKLQPALLHQAQQLLSMDVPLVSHAQQDFPTPLAGRGPGRAHHLSGEQLRSVPISNPQDIGRHFSNLQHQLQASHQGASAGWHVQHLRHHQLHPCPWHLHRCMHRQCRHAHQITCSNSQAHQLMQARWAHRYHGMHARHGWAKASDERDRIISALHTWQQLRLFWQQYGGAPQQLWDSVKANVQGRLQTAQYSTRSPLRPDKKVRPAQLTSCRLTYLNLARFTEQLQRRLPRQLHHPSFDPEQHAEGLEQAGLAAEQLDEVRQVVEDVCAKQLRRGKLCDPATAGRMLLALGRLGYLECPALTQLMLDLSTRRMEEAYLRDICTTAQALHLLEYKEGGAWWAAAWRHVANILPTGMYNPAQVSRLFEVGAATGHPAPARVQALHEAMSSRMLANSQAPQALQASTRQQSAQGAAA